MVGQRDAQIFPIYGQTKYQGDVVATLMPTNGIPLLVGAIGSDNIAGFGMTGTVGTGSTTLNGGVSAGAGSIVVVSGAGFSTGQVVQIDVNNPATPTTSELRKITVSGTTFTLDVPLSFAHLTGVAVIGVVAPYTHTVRQQNLLPSFTIEKNLGGFESEQYAGCRINKYSLKAEATNKDVDYTATLFGRSAAVLSTPTPISSAITNETPFSFTELTLNWNGTPRYEAYNLQLDIENFLKETWSFAAFAGAQGPSYITPTKRRISGKFDVVFSSLDDATYGYFNQMLAAHTAGIINAAFVHPASAGSVTVQCEKARLAKLGDELRMADVVLQTLNFEAELNLALSPSNTIFVTIVNSTYLPHSL